MSTFTDDTQKPQRPSWLLLLMTTIYPLGVLIIELYKQMCAATFFDPIPTFAHVLLVLLVPVSHGLIWVNLRYKTFIPPKILLLLGAAAIGVSGYYTVIFLPLTPLGLVGILLYGLGFLILGPLISLIYGLKLFRLARETYNQPIAHSSSTWRGLYIVLVCLVLLDIPATSTYLGLKWATSDDQQTQQQGINLLRHIGDEDILLRLSYDSSRNSGGIISFLVVITDTGEHVPVSKYRQIFYQVTGTPFNQHPLPYTQERWARINDETGGSEIGRKVKGLNLIASRIDGSINADEGIAYTEWTMTFKNDHRRAQEARMQLALPPGSVLSRATLWVNDESREAAFGKRSQVRKAYERVVSTLRDPLLVTTIGADRILAQAFPIPANGGTLKFRLGITTPLTLTSEDNANMVMPAIIAHNFAINDDVQHALWLESKNDIKLDLGLGLDIDLELGDSTLANNSDIKHTSTQGDEYRIRGNLANSLLTNPFKVLSAKRDISKTQTIARFQDFPTVKQTVTKATSQPANALMLIVDGSAGLAPHKQALITAIKQLPNNANLGLIIASNPLISVDVARIEDSHQQLLIDTINDYDFVGGQDNTQAITKAILALENTDDAQVLWIHAPQPILFDNSKAQLEQVNDRVSQIPKFSLYSVNAGPNKLVENAEFTWLSLAQTLPQTQNFNDDLAGYLNQLFNPKPQFIFAREPAQKSDIKATPTGSTHVARLWAFEKITRALQNDSAQPAMQGPIMNMAINYQLVTPVSGAVVLENAQQYEQNDLTPVDASTVPTIPEPHQWMLTIILLLLMLWFLKHNKLTLTKLT